MSEMLEPVSRETPEVEELTATLHRRIDRFVPPVVLLILAYYGGRQYGGSHFVNHALWQDIILWPFAVAGAVVVILDRSGRHGDKRLFSRWLARKLVARRGAPTADQQTPQYVPAQYVPAGQGGEPGMSRRGVLILAGSTALVVLAVMITGIAAADSSSGNSSSGRQLTVYQLRPGDCLTGSNMGLGTNSDWPDRVAAVPCTRRHLAEVFFAGNVWPQSLTAYPGDNAVFSQARARCSTAFATYDGIDNSASSFTFDYVAPSGSSDWAWHDRRVVCVAYDPGRPVKYSIKGSRQ
jgi:hypothetical protein